MQQPLPLGTVSLTPHTIQPMYKCRAAVHNVNHVERDTNTGGTLDDTSHTISPDVSEQRTAALQRLVASTRLFEKIQQHHKLHALPGFIMGHWSASEYREVIAYLDKLTSSDEQRDFFAEIAERKTRPEIQRVVRSALDGNWGAKRRCGDGFVDSAMEILKLVDEKKAKDLHALLLLY